MIYSTIYIDVIIYKIKNLLPSSGIRQSIEEGKYYDLFYLFFLR